MPHLFKEHDFIAVRPLASNIIIVIPLIEDETNGLFFIGWNSDKVYLSNLTDENGFSNVVPIPKENPDFYNQYPHLLPQALECHIGYKETL